MGSFRKKMALFCEEPYRLLFPLGTVLGTVGVSHWLFYSLGWIPRYSMYFHSSMQMQGYLLCFVLGFLLTAMPKFASAAPASPGELARFTLLIGGITLSLANNRWAAGESCFFLSLLLLGVFARRRFLQKGKLEPPLEFVWIPMALAQGMIAAALLIGARIGWLPVWFLGVGKPMLEQGFILSIVAGVGGFLTPRLIGRQVPVTDPALKRKRILIHAAAALLLFTSFWIEGSGFKTAAYFLRAGVITAELWICRTLPLPPRVPDLFVRLLWVSMWCVGGGLWAAALLPAYRVAMLHLTFIGGLSLMTFAVGTMVTLSHSGQGELLRKPLWVLKLTAAGLGAAIALRLASPFVPGIYFPVLGTAAACWLIAGVGWLSFILPAISRVPRAGEFEACHEEAKQRIMDAKKDGECCDQHHSC